MFDSCINVSRSNKIRHGNPGEEANLTRSGMQQKAHPEDELQMFEDKCIFLFMILISTVIEIVSIWILSV